MLLSRFHSHNTLRIHQGLIPAPVYTRVYTSYILLTFRDDARGYLRGNRTPTQASSRIGVVASQAAVAKEEKCLGEVFKFFPSLGCGGLWSPSLPSPFLCFLQLYLIVVYIFDGVLYNFLPLWSATLFPLAVHCAWSFNADPLVFLSLYPRALCLGKESLFMLLRDTMSYTMLNEIFCHIFCSSYCDPKVWSQAVLLLLGVES